MKLAKRLIAVVVVAVMLASSFAIFASAAMLTYKNSHSVTSDGAVKFTKYSAAGKHTETATVLEFNPKNGYIPVAFVGNPSSVATIPTQYTTAVNTYGYEVAGMINAGYFTMATSTLEGMVVTDGKIVATTRGSHTVVAFGSDGSMDIVTTQPKFTVGFNGQSFDNPIYYVNKDYNDAKADYQNSYMFYYDYSNNANPAYASGVEITLEKQSNTELSYGETLVGKVVYKRTGATGTSLTKNQFVLYAKSGSAYADELNSLAVGDTVTISVSETNGGAVKVMNKANSVINNIDYLVKDGKNYTTGKTSVGGHNPTTTYARWTAYGIKADGSYVFFTSEGGTTGDSSRSLNLNDVANALIELGCVTAVRLDGGGSTGMYVSNTGSGSKGWVMEGQRKVADTILIVKKSSMHDSALENQLKAAIATAKQTAGTNASILKAVAEAEALIGTNATEGQLRKAITSLSPKAILGQALAQCETLNIGEYAEPDLATVRSAYKAAKAVYNSESATDSQYSAQTVKIYEALNKSASVILSTGAAYKTTAPNRGDGHDDDGYRLTDGVKGGTDLAQYSYSGWGVAGLDGKIVNVDIDLGTVQSSNTFTVYAACGQWGIQTPNMTLNVYTSTDGVNYNKLVASTTTRNYVTSNVVSGETCKTYTYTAVSDSIVEARYVRFSILNNSNFTWIDEVEVSRTQDNKYNPVTNFIKIQSFDTKITAGSSTIFTPALGALNQSNANHTWSCNVICEKQSDGSYVVVENVGCHGNSSKVITLKSNQIMISAHNDPTVPGSDVNANTLNAAKVGQVLHLFGIDVNSKTVDVAAYVKFLNKGEVNPDLVEKEDNNDPVDPKPPVDDPIDPKPPVDDPVTPSGMKGDINGNKEIDSMDYVLLKRAYFGTYKLSDISVGDLNSSGKIDSMDYVFLKRAYFGTYVIK